MAFVATIDSTERYEGTPGRVLVTGTYTNGVADTGGEIIPISLDPESGLRKIIRFGFTSITAASQAPSAVVTYDAAVDAFKITITCVADDDGVFWIEGEDAGA